MGDQNISPRKINKLEGVAGQVIVSGGPGVVENWTSRAILTVAETEVFNGVSPNVWTGLDLSGTIGANAALVLLKVYCPTIGRTVAFRKAGDADEFYVAAYADPAGCALVHMATAVHYVVLVATSDAGVIEWKMSVATANTTVDIIAYIKNM